MTGSTKERRFKRKTKEGNKKVGLMKFLVGYHYHIFIYAILIRVDSLQPPNIPSIVYHCRNDATGSNGMDEEIGIIENPITRREDYIFEAQLIYVTNRQLCSNLP